MQVNDLLVGQCIYIAFALKGDSLKPVINYLMVIILLSSLVCLLPSNSLSLRKLYLKVYTESLKGEERASD